MEYRIATTSGETLDIDGHIPTFSTREKAEKARDLLEDLIDREFFVEPDNADILGRA